MSSIRHFTVEVAAPGDLTLQFDHLDGLNRLDFAGTTLTPAHEITVGLPAGRHHGMVRLIPSQRQSPLKLTLKAADATQGAAAGVRVVTPE
ncbi:hypothetical protein BH23VER1_BH23VER1_21780 [soil metagenome]